jgi:hypothetical protein
MVRFHVTAAAALFTTATASIAARQTAAPSVEVVSDCSVILSTQYVSVRFKGGMYAYTFN